jgi:molecular chaperone GrpE
MTDHEMKLDGPEDDRDAGARLDAGAADPSAANTAAPGVSDVDALRGELADVRRQLIEKQDQHLRAVAEMDNARRRAQRDREEYTRYATESLLRELIPVLDNLDRALEAARAAGNAPSVVQGVELIQREFLRVLERAGVTRYSAVGQRFDPTRHEAVSRVVAVDTPPDTVVAETSPGYMLNGRVLRAALVSVAAAPDEDAA